MYIPERREVKALAEHLLVRAGRSDIRVSVAYILNFRIDEETSLNVLVDPTENYSRAMMKKVVDGAITQLNQSEEQRDLLESRAVESPPRPGVNGVVREILEESRPEPRSSPADEPIPAQTVESGRPSNTVLALPPYNPDNENI